VLAVLAVLTVLTVLAVLAVLKHMESDDVTVWCSMVQYGAVHADAVSEHIHVKFKSGRSPLAYACSYGQAAVHVG